MELKRMLQWLMLAVLPLFLFTGCGDLEPEMQDTRTVILKMNLNEKSSSRTSQSHEAATTAYQTHLILAVGHWAPVYSQPLTSSSSYKEYYYSTFHHNRRLMDPQSGEVEMEIELNTDMKIFAFLFSGDYDEFQLITGNQVVDNFGQSDIFCITTTGRPGCLPVDTQTNRLSLGISLEYGIQDTTNTVTDTTAPTVTFSPAHGTQGVPISTNITITFSEAVRNIDDSELTNSNCGDAYGVGSLITLRNNASGANIACYATIDSNKRVITIDPTSNLPTLRSVSVYIGATVEDSADNAIAATFATYMTMP